MMKSRSQALITGVYRTGTEYITHCVNSHPALSATMYKVNVFRFALHRFDPVHEPKNYTAAVKEIAARMRTRYNDDIPVKAILQALGHAPKVNYCVLYDAVMSALYVNESTPHWAEKNQLQWREIPLFLEGMPNGRAIMVVRDPRAVTASFRRFTYAQPPAYLGSVFNCLDAMQHARDYAERYPKSFMTIRYEDFMQAPKGVTRAVWRFLGLSDDHPLTPQKEWRDPYGDRWGGNSAFQKANSPFDAAAALNRHSTLSRAELDLTEAVCGELMAHFNYEVESRKPDWDAVHALIGGNPEITALLETWQRRGTGIQAFPSDPRDPQNWRKRGKEVMHDPQ